MSADNLVTRYGPETDTSGATPMPERLIFGRSSAMQEVGRSVAGVAGEFVPVLLLGERGVGKEMVAREIHHRSPWRLTPFIKVSGTDWATLSSGLARQREAAPSSDGSRPSDFSGCTLFIEEVSQLASSLQVKLLEFLHDRSSGHRDLEFRYPEHTRVICTSSRNLADEITSGSFRLDLFYRINVVTINIPALRNRTEDIPDLAEYFFQLSCRERKALCSRLTANLLRLFSQYDWPGNIPELENCVRTYVESGADVELVESLISPKKAPSSGSNASGHLGNRIPLKAYTRQLVEQAEKDLILRVLREQRWNRKEAAKVLQVSYQTLLHKLKQTGLTRKRRTQSDVVDQPVQE